MRTVKYLKFIVLFSFMILSASCKKEHDLFTDLNKNWIEKGDADWNFSKDLVTGIVNDETGFLYTKEAYSNFVLEVEFKPDSTINSGVFVRCKNDSISPANCYEINIWDLHPNQEYRTGAIVLKSTPKSKVNTIDAWNLYKIKCYKNHIQAWINDVLVADLEDSDHNEGVIGLQAAGTGEIQFRNARLVTIDDD